MCDFEFCRFPDFGFAPSIKGNRPWRPTWSNDYWSRQLTSSIDFEPLIISECSVTMTPRNDFWRGMSGRTRMSVSSNSAHRPERTHGYSYSSCCFIFCCELTARGNLFERPVEDLFKRSDSGYCCRDLYEHGADLHVL